MHDTTITHRFDWACAEHSWTIDCHTCGWTSDPQRTLALALEREEQHVDLPEADREAPSYGLSER
jgi:hypothetical protein